MFLTKDFDGLLMGGVLADTQVAADTSLASVALLTTCPQFPQKRALPSNSDPQISHCCMVIPGMLKMSYLYSSIFAKVTLESSIFCANLQWTTPLNTE